MTDTPRRAIPWGRLGIEFLVIVTGVLVALAMDQWAQGRADEVAAREVLQAVGSELATNLGFLEDRIEYHTRVQPGLDSLHALAQSGQRTNLLREAVMPEGRAFLPLRDTAWQLALITEVVRHLDIDLTSTLSLTYGQFESLRELEQVITNGIVRPEWFAIGADRGGAATFLAVLMEDLVDIEEELARLMEESIRKIRDRLGDDFVGAAEVS